MDELVVEVLREEGNEDLPLPSYQSSLASGLDLYAACAGVMVLEPGRVLLVPTGIRVAIPAGYEGQVRPRSGLALKHGITVLNTPGTIDADYRGPVGVILINLGTATYEIERGMRIAQLVISRVERARLRMVGRLDETQRGEGGFGHTGLRDRREGRSPRT